MSHLLSFERPSHWIDQLVPERLEQNSLDRARRRAFILPRLAFAGATLLAAPAWLFVFGAPTPGEALLFVLAQTPLVSVVTLARTGDLWLSRTISVLGWLALAAALPQAGLDDPALFVALLAAALVEAALVSAPTALILMAAAGVALAAFLLTAHDLTAHDLTAHDLTAHAAGSPLLSLLGVPVLAYVAMLVRCAQIAEQRRPDVGAEQARESRLLTEALGDIVLQLDAGGAVVDVLGKAHQAYALDRRDLMGRGLFQRVHIADRPAFLKLVSDVAREGAPAAVALRAQVGLEAAATGPYAEPVFKDFEARMWREGAAGGVVCALRDFTAQKRADAALATAQVESERAHSTKARFLANISHELRTPLNAIIGFSELLANPDLAPTDPAKQREYAGIVASSGHHLLQVVNTILDMSKIDSGSMQIFPEPLSLPVLIDECCDMLQLKADQGGVRLLRDYARERGDIVADRRACKQILINLLSNAVKFTPAGGRVRIHVAPEGNLLSVTVADTGIGVAPADLGRLGDPFFQASATHDRAYEGTGLGLSVVRGLVGLHGGAITIESAPKKGTAVTVRLPLDCRNAGAANSAALIETVPRLGADLRHPQQTVKQSA